MFTYKLHFTENGNRSTNTVKNLDAAHKIAVSYLENSHGLLTTCEITTPTGCLSIVKKTGEKHLIHDGYSFGFIHRTDVEKYRSMQK